MTVPNPLIPGFNPDPSIVCVDGVYYIVTSSFEYLPGMPVYRSVDFTTWEHIGNVATRPEQVEVGDVVTAAGVWAPTIRYRDGLFYVIVTVAASPRGCVVFTATDPAGPWSDGVTIDGVAGIDPDIAWDDDGTCYVTFAGLGISTGEDYAGIMQVRVDLDAGRAIEPPRSMWSGTGLIFAEAPHLYRRGDYWYLMIAEGGTERGHSVSVARGPAPYGPFTGHPANPILTASGTGRPIENTGHADLVSTPDGDRLVLLGVRPTGVSRSFSPLGRETYSTPVTWSDDWPAAEPVQLTLPGAELTEEWTFTDPSVLNDPGWLAVRAAPTAVAHIAQSRLLIDASPSGLRDLRPSFLGRRQRHLTSTTTVVVEQSAGVGGLASRYHESMWFGIEVGGGRVTASAVLIGVQQQWHLDLTTDDDVELTIETALRPPALTSEAQGGDVIRLYANGCLLTELDGRYWSSETCVSFTGRVTGMYAAAGSVAFRSFRYRGMDT